MFISIEDLVMFVGCPVLFLICMVIYFRQTSKENYERYSEKNDLCRSLIKELEQYKKKERLEKYGV